MVTNTNFDANENPTFVDGCNIDGKRGVYVKGENVIHLDAPEIYFPKNAPLPTDKRELYAILNELFQGGSGGGDDWSLPEWWIPVPEPEAYDIYILVWAYKGTYGNTGMNFELYLCRESDNGIGYGNIFCDWGDGTTDEIGQRGNPSHTYTEEGQYLIHIVADENSNCWRSSASNQAAWQIVKTGENIAFVTDYNEQNGYYPYGALFPSKFYLKWIQINHPKGLPTALNVNGNIMESFYALKKIELKKKFLGNILRSSFQNCGLSDFSQILDADEIQSVGNDAFRNCTAIKKIYLPNCTSIGESAFSGCYNLQEIVVSEDCTFGTNCFQNCYSLYPRPDGSVI